MPIVATAGHVDHGKSTLIIALTGIDPDRWTEEKERGLTIDLGFAWAKLDDDTEVAFVDVPGHERFIKNMLAGIGGLDVALLVVAADGGWMPQTEEHAAVLDLLEVTHGVIAVTRIDLVDHDLVELCEFEVAERTVGTTLEHWPVVPVSAITGEGIGKLKRALLDALALVSRNTGDPYLWVDRSFTIDGAGTVVTGTLAGGPITRDTALVQWPEDKPVRIRGLQTLGRDADEIAPGSRVAVNLSGIDAAQVRRGTVLAPPDTYRPTSRFLTKLRKVRTVEKLTDRGAYHLHVGSGSWPATLRIVEGLSDKEGVALVTTQTPVPLRMGDRVIIRDTGRRMVAAGGRVLDPHPAPKSRRYRKTIVGLRHALKNRTSFADALLQARGSTDLEELRRDTGGVPTAGTVVASTAFTDERLAMLGEKLSEFIATFHIEFPLRPGTPKATLATQLGVDVAVIEYLGSDLDTIHDDGPTLRLDDFIATYTRENDSAWQHARATLLANDLSVPRLSELGLDEELLHALIREHSLERIDSDLVYLPEQMITITSRLADLEGTFSVADFRDALGVSRRQAVPLLEWLDSNGWTTRTGDVRTLRQRP
ncbi:MAG: selenocysteine-specific translation elongation factor [Acidobacteria bacterium]|nr:selenocysteine-specific translation elongation factor [Acidobacteriota bacterium]